MPALLLQITTWDRIQSIRQEFMRGGSFGEVILAVLAIVVLLCVVALVYRLQQRGQGRELDNAEKLYRSLLQRLELSVPQRDLLRRIAAAQHLENPTVLLLGRRIFEQYAQQALAARTADADGTSRIEELADRLFPAGYRTPTSASAARPPTSETKP